MKFRAAQINDLEQLRVLEQKVVEAERPFNSSIRSAGAYYYDIEHLISSDASFMLVAQEADDIVATGYAQIRTSKPSQTHDIDSYLGFMYVVPNFRGRGVNKVIVDRLIDWSRGKGASDFYLDVYSDNLPAINAYKKAGFLSSMIEMKLSL